MKIFAVVLLICSALLWSCKQSSTQPGESNSLSGKVLLLTEYSDTLADRSNVKVQVGNRSITGLSNAKGEWNLSNLPTGDILLVFSKEGFCTYEQEVSMSSHSDSHFSTLEIRLDEYPTYTVDSLDAEVDPSDHALTISGTVSSLPKSVYGKKVVLYFCKASTISSLPTEYDFYTDVTAEYGRSTFVRNISADVLANNGIAPGDTLHCVAYPAGERTLCGYSDPATRKVVLTSIGQIASNEVSVVFQ